MTMLKTFVFLVIGALAVAAIHILMGFDYGNNQSWKVVVHIVSLVVWGGIIASHKR
jgi:hypothetical protein